MSKGSKAKRDVFGAHMPEPEPAQGELTLDSLEPDYQDECDVCGESPTVTGERHGRIVVRWHLCGPCCFGEARMLDPREWNE